jgi:hypothetical protein
VQDDFLAGRGERQGALAGGNGLVRSSHEAEVDGQKVGDPSQPTRVGKGLGLAEVYQDTSQVVRRSKR